MGFPAYDMRQADLAWGRGRPPILPRRTPCSLPATRPPPRAPTDLPNHTPETSFRSARTTRGGLREFSGETA